MSAHRERRFCLCGASMDARSVPPTFAKGLAVIFEDYHRGEGHGPATPSQATRIRRRLEAQVERAEREERKAATQGATPTSEREARSVR